VLSITPRDPARPPPHIGRARVLGLLAASWVALLALLAGPASAAQPPVGLGTAGPFAVLAGSTVTNTGPSTINGDLGVAPGTAVTGVPPATVNGTIHAADAVAAQAQADLTIAYDDAAGRGPSLSVSGNLGGLTLTSGVYRSGSSLALTGTLTLDAQGDPDAVFVLQAGSSLITASGSSVTLINGAQPCNVFWKVGSSATLGTSSLFTGSILALTSISLNDGVTVEGRALARNGAVTLINDTITVPRCATPGTSRTPGTTTPTSGTPGTTTPAPGTPGTVTPAPGTPGTVTPAPGTPGTVTPAPGAPGTTTPAAGTLGTAASPGSPPVGAPGSRNGTALLTTAPRTVAQTVSRYGTSRCVEGAFRVLGRGLFIRRVVFSLGGRVIATRTSAPFVALVQPIPGITQRVSALFAFSDATLPVRLSLRFRACRATEPVFAQTPVAAPRPARIARGFTG